MESIEEKESLLDVFRKEGEVKLKLETYNGMMEIMDKLLETTKTHKEFTGLFRKSFLVLVHKAKEQGIDLQSLYDYYEDLNFNPIEDFTVAKVDAKEEGEQPQWIVTLKTKEIKNEGPSIVPHG